MEDRILNYSQPRTVVLFGMGGSGKTQLAFEFCRQAGEILNFMAVIWIDAASPVSVARAYKLIAKKISKNRQDSTDTETTIQFVQEALRNWKRRWLVVFDNYDNPKAFQRQGIHYYIPSGNNGRILFTSRHADSKRLGYPITVSGMSDEESLDLLLQRPPIDQSEKAAGLDIVSTLGHLALALDQAGAYIRARNLQLKEFTRHYNERREIVLKEIPDEWEYRKETTLSIFATWELSFEQITGDNEERKKKDHFLTLAAFFDNTNISESYFQAHFSQERPKWMDICRTRAEWDSEKLRDILAELQKLSLLQISDKQTDELQFSIHPVVRDWLKLRKNNNIRQKFATELKIMLTHYLIAVADNDLSLKIDQETLLHIDSCVQNGGEIFKRSSNTGLDDYLVSASLFADFYLRQGRYDEAEKLFKRALAESEKLDLKHLETLTAVQNLATVYRIKGRYNEAEELYKRALTGREEKLGLKHPHTLHTVLNLESL